MQVYRDWQSNRHSPRPLTHSSNISISQLKMPAYYLRNYGHSIESGRFSSSNHGYSVYYTHNTNSRRFSALEEHRINPDYIHPCECGVQPTSVDDLEEHIQLECPYWIPCSECHAIFSTSHALRMHVRRYFHYDPQFNNFIPSFVLDVGAQGGSCLICQRSINGGM